MTRTPYKLMLLTHGHYCDYTCPMIEERESEEGEPFHTYTCNLDRQRLSYDALAMRHIRTRLCVDGGTSKPCKDCKHYDTHRVLFCTKYHAIPAYVQGVHLPIPECPGPER